MDHERLTVTVAEAAAMIGISPAHGYELIRLGKLPAIRLGRRLIVPKKALEQFLDQALLGPAVDVPGSTDEPPIGRRPGGSVVSRPPRTP